MQNLLAILQSIRDEDRKHKENSTYASAMMILKITADEAKEEFERASDELRLKFDEGFLSYLAELANKNNSHNPEKKGYKNS